MTHGFTRDDRRYSEDEKQYIREHKADGAAAIAAVIGRSVTSVFQMWQRLGLSRKNADSGPRFEAFILGKHALGWSDAEMAEAWGCDRHSVLHRRAKLGLPHNALSEHRRRRVAEKTREQVKLAGLRSLADVRVKAFRDYAKKYGWPEDLRPRQVQMLNALMRHGPMTRRQIADTIGMPWKGSRKSLVGNVPEGSYLANLMTRGLVVQLGRCVKGKGRGRSVNLYSIPLWTERKAS